MEVMPLLCSTNLVVHLILWLLQNCSVVVAQKEPRDFFLFDGCSTISKHHKPRGLPGSMAVAPPKPRSSLS